MCPGVIDPEGVQAHAIHSSQKLTFHMMLATKHHFHSIQERANVFIPLEFRDPRDIRPRWRTASFQYLDGVWEWVQVMSDHVASHYTLLANAHGAKPAQSPAIIKYQLSLLPQNVLWPLTYHLLGSSTRVELPQDPKIQFKMSKLMQGHPTLLVHGTPGMNNSRTNQGSSLPTKSFE